MCEQGNEWKQKRKISESNSEFSCQKMKKKGTTKFRLACLLSWESSRNVEEKVYEIQSVFMSKAVSHNACGIFSAFPATPSFNPKSKSINFPFTLFSAVENILRINNPTWIVNLNRVKNVCCCNYFIEDFILETLLFITRICFHNASTSTITPSVCLLQSHTFRSSFNMLSTRKSLL